MQGGGNTPLAHPSHQKHNHGCSKLRQFPTEMNIADLFWFSSLRARSGRSGVSGGTLVSRSLRGGQCSLPPVYSFVCFLTQSIISGAVAANILNAV